MGGKSAGQNRLIMKINEEARMLRIYLSSTDRFRHRLLFEVIVFAAKRYGIAGATVLKGIMGYGSSRTLYSESIWEISEKIPIIVEIVDEHEKIENFLNIILPYFKNLKKGILVTSEKVNIVYLSTGKTELE
jgi:PII-like signaling protein